MLPLLLRPKLLSIKNRWKSGFDLKKSFGRDIVIALFSFGITFGIYYGTTQMLDLLSDSEGTAYFPPGLPLTAILFTLMVMLFFSNAVSALGAFMLAKDMDLLLAAPVSTWRLFLGKFSEVVLSSSWMAMIFGGPVIIAFGIHYHAQFSFYILSFLILAPYFVIPSAISVTAVQLISRVIPASRTKEILILAFTIFLWCIYSVFKIIAPAGAGYPVRDDILHLLAFFTKPLTEWMPSNWAGSALGSLLKPGDSNWQASMLLLYCCAIFFASTAYIAVRLFHHSSYSLSGSSRQRISLRSTRGRGLLGKLFPALNPQYRAIFAKEGRMFSRDMTQAIQLLLLMGLCLIYLYNFKLMHGVQNMAEATKVWWHGFLVASNLIMGAFVITAICSRFVFPSISLEGQGFWMLQSGPITIKDILRAKFWCWLVPVATISSVIFASGSYAIGAETKLVVVNAIVSWMISYGIVGLAIGLGAVFANFDWEHPSQLSASFGSLVFMMASTGLIFLNLIPAGVPIFLRTIKSSGIEFTAFQWWTCLTLSVILLMWINYKTTAWALRTGEASIAAKM